MGADATAGWKKTGSKYAAMGDWKEPAFGSKNLSMGDCRPSGHPDASIAEYVPSHCAIPGN